MEIVFIAAGLQHPHIVGVVSAGDADGLPYFVMPFVEGQSLRSRIREGPLSIREAVRILRDVAWALSYAHAQGVVHRDIKPDNVLLSSDPPPSPTSASPRPSPRLASRRHNPKPR